MMVTEGSKGKTIEWRHIRHFAFEALRKKIAESIIRRNNDC